MKTKILFFCIGILALMITSGCCSILNPGSSYLEVKAPPNVSWTVYKTDSQTKKTEFYQSNQGNATIYLEKKNCPMWKIVANNGASKEVNPEPFWIGIVLDLGFGPLIPLAVLIDGATGAAANYPSRIDLSDYTPSPVQANSSSSKPTTADGSVVFENGVPRYVGTPIVFK